MTNKSENLPEKSGQNIPVGGMMPYEKLRTFGPEALTDEELLAIVLRCGTRGEGILNLSHRLLSTGEDPGKLIRLTRMSFQELTRIKGIGPVKAAQLTAISEIAKRIAGQQREKLLKFNEPASVADYYMERMRHLEKERVMLLLLDNKCSLIKDMIISEGTVNTSLISVREIFIEAIRYKAVFIMLLHNHPSGDPRPSVTDLNITRNVKEASVLLEIPLLDHIIIGDNKYYSLKEHSKDGK